MSITLEGYTDTIVEDYFFEKINQNNTATDELQQRLTTLNNCTKTYTETKNTLKEWIKKHRPKKSSSESFSEQVNQINDCVLRSKMFKLATHYWEARWLREMEGIDVKNKEQSPSKMPCKYRRFAKLTPCFVSTFYMTPSLFTAYQYLGPKEYLATPLFSEIDLLIIDEAGQASPEVASASFALAKRALVVGDVDQIEPVWNLSVGIDRSNLKLFNLFDNERGYDEFWLKNGLLASSGNVMTIAQRQCHYHQIPSLARGLYLTEHRRCYNGIIGYCNELVYDGHLKPLRGNPKQDVPWGVMSFISTIGTSESHGGSRANPNEAKIIAGWLHQKQHKIITYARSQDINLPDEDQKILSTAVGIITPFKAQELLIRKELKEKNITGITVGTVHKLQGAERLIVLFSSVYGANDCDSSKFYDMNNNMLNVAVSRAKDSFIVFGNSIIFGMPKSNSPSGILRSKLINIDERATQH